jgi:hypothetical protein
VFAIFFQRVFYQQRSKSSQQHIGYSSILHLHSTTAHCAPPHHTE